MKIGLKKYTAGDLARFYGVTPDTIRFYDKKGILTPLEKEKNNYRVYTRSDMITLDYIFRLRDSGIPLSEINELINDTSPADAIERCRKQILVLNQEIQVLNSQKRQLELFTEEIANLDKNSQVTVKMSPALFLKDLDEDIVVTRKWFNDHNLSQNCKMTAYNNRMLDQNFKPDDLDSVQLRSDMADLYLSVPIDESRIPELQSAITDSSFIIPSQLCLYSVYKAVFSQKNIFIDLFRFHQFAEKHNFKLKEEAFSTTVFIESLNRDKVFYYEFWWPIEND